MSILDGFVARVNREQLPVDAVVAYRGEQLIGEHRWSPDVPGNIYSHTKSFMVTAVGAAIYRGLSTLGTRLIAGRCLWAHSAKHPTLTRTISTLCSGSRCWLLRARSSAIPARTAISRA